MPGLSGSGSYRPSVSQPHGEPRDRVRARGQQLPQVLGAARPAGVPAAHRHDRDRLAVPLPQLLQALASLSQLGGDLVEVVAKLLLFHRCWASQTRNPSELLFNQVEHLVVRGRLELQAGRGVLLGLGAEFLRDRVEAGGDLGCGLVVPPDRGEQGGQPVEFVEDGPVAGTGGERLGPQGRPAPPGSGSRTAAWRAA